VEAASNKRTRATKKANIIALTLSELIALYNHPFPEGSRLEEARDLFVLELSPARGGRIGPGLIKAKSMVIHGHLMPPKPIRKQLFF
jgi:hypothetical protein